VRSLQGASPEDSLRAVTTRMVEADVGSVLASIGTLLRQRASAR
jgi:hypothetical protein